ncbi:DUF3465 domain-containing protein [Acinetobacter piscicola]|uniref:DUF3465 domain-containing protein n=1 Tax=Acinetobacter piscicola TaxID=2006115 RepID=UPI000B7FE8E8|nr:DUF3465 domain-containing protein [Acinetobacter piscicola]
MANKTQLGIGAAIAVLVAAYFGIDLNQQKNEPVQQPKVEYSDQPNSHTQQNSNPSVSHEDPIDEKKNHQVQNDRTQNHPYTNSQSQHGLEVIAKSYERKLSNVQVQSVGRVKAILRDDNDGSRHQKFILTLENGLTVLVAHNIDLAPRVDNLHKGDTVEFFGEYEYSTQGGVIHWTHRDPQHRHENGWLKHDGKTYQ